MNKNKINIVYVADNRDMINLGCRGTSIALSQLLSKEFSISARVHRKLISKSFSVENEILQGGIWDYVQKREKIKKIYKILERTFFGNRKINLIVGNPEQSLANLIQHKDKYRELNDIYQNVQESDALIINGEGEMIFREPPRYSLLFTMMLIELAHYLHKPIYYINAMVSDCPQTGKKTEIVFYAMKSLGKCDIVSLRDPLSMEIVKNFNAKINAIHIPDALFSWRHYFVSSCLPSNGDYLIAPPEDDYYFGKFDFSEPYICVSGSSLAPYGNIKPATDAFLKLVEKLKGLGLKIYLIEGCSGDHFLRKVGQQSDIPCIPGTIPILMAGSILANARLFISGRYHPSIFASLGGTPCVFLGSNSHKTKSLQQVLEYDNPVEFSAFPNDNECEQIFLLAQEKINQGYSLRESILKVVDKKEQESAKIVDLVKSNLLSKHEH